MKRITIFGALLIPMMSCSQQNISEKLNGTDEKIPVKVAKSESRQFTPSIELSGTAYADKEANLGAALPGRVEKVYYPEGSRVKKGDLLVSLSGELCMQAMVEFKTVEKDFERVSRLNDKGSVSQQEFDHVKAMYDAGRAKVEMMKKNTEIIAPFSGTIVEYLVNEGENYFFNINLEPGYSKTSGILRLMKLDPIQVKIEVNEKDMGSLRTGQNATVSFDALPSTTFTGKLSGIEQFLSTLTHTAGVKIELPNSSGKIKPGMFAHVKIGLNPMNSVSVPMAAIYRQPGTADDFIFIVSNNKVRRQKIDRLWTDDSLVGINGINSGETVVTSGKEKLHDGSLIEIKYQEEK
jgi:membrane fusion protein, multidrug efflux system